MFCVYCGANVQAGQTFCSNCGQTVSIPSAPATLPTSPTPPGTSPSVGIGTSSVVARHTKVLGILWTIFSALRLIPAVAMLVFGHARFPFLLAPFPGMFHAFLGPILSMIGLGILGLAVAGLIAGLGLMAYKPWARVLAIILGCINLIHIPFGTALGIYTLWVLFSSAADREYQRLGTQQASTANPAV